MYHCILCIFIFLLFYILKVKSHGKKAYSGFKTRIGELRKVRPDADDDDDDDQSLWNVFMIIRVFRKFSRSEPLECFHV